MLSFLAYGTSCLNFVAQLRIPPASLRRIELQNIRHQIRGPGLWVPAAKLFYYLKDLRLFPCQLHAYQPLCNANMVRAGPQGVGDWRALHAELHDTAVSGDEDCVYPLFGNL